MASADTLLEAWEEAFVTDQQAPFGGIIVVNQTMDVDLAVIIGKIFCEVIIAPAFTEAAREVFAKKKNLRLMTVKASLPADSLREVRSVVGGVLMQDRDICRIAPATGGSSLSVSHHRRNACHGVWLERG